MMKKKKIGNGVATNSVLLMSVQVITTLLGLIVTKLLSVNFSLKEYGTYSQALLITTTATNLSILGLTNATNYFYNRTQMESQQKSYLSTIFFIQYISGFICALIIIIFRYYISNYFCNEELPNVLLIVAFTPIMTNLIAMYQTLFVSIGEAKKIAVRNFIVSTIRLISVFIACFVTNNITTVLIAILLMDVAQLVCFSTMFKKDKYSIDIWKIDFNLVKEILTFSIPMAIYVLFNSLSRDIDKYVVSAFSNTETLAIYTNAAKVLPFDMLTTSLITVLIPIVTRYINQQKYHDAQNVFKLYLRIGYLLTCIFVGGAIAHAKYLMLFLYDVKYLSGILIFIIYLMIDMIRFANVTTILSGAGKSNILMKISIFALISNFILNIIGYKFLGILGPAVVTLILTIVMTIILLFYGSREIKTTIFMLFDFKEIGIVGVEIIIFGILAHFFAQILEIYNVPIFLIIILSYGSYLMVLLILNRKRIIDCFKKLNTYK